MNKLGKFCENCIAFFVRLLKLKNPEQKTAVLYQLFKFCLVGVSNTLISTGCSHVLMVWGVSFWVYTPIAFFLSVTNAFIWSNLYVFKKGDGEQRNWLLVYVKTVLCYATTGIFLSYALMYLWVYVVGIPEWIGPIINLLITIPINFVLNKLWAFKN